LAATYALRKSRQLRKYLFGDSVTIIIVLVSPLVPVSLVSVLLVLMRRKNFTDRLKDAEERLESVTERLHPIMLRGIFPANVNETLVG
jgi:hypothetical protein